MTTVEQEFIESFVKSVVEIPDAVSTEIQQDEMGVLITLHVDKQDMGRVIGKNGETAKSLRTLLHVLGSKRKARVNLKIYDPEYRSSFEERPRLEQHPKSIDEALEDL